MSKNLVIVESPAKAKTIQKFLGKDFEVKSSYGHIRDLVKKGGLGVDVDNNYEPSYIVPDDKAKLVKELKAAVKKVDEVWLATDEDREGEAISWHLCEVLGLDPKETKRIVFHEITKTAIQKAVQNPRSLDLDVVNAQQARRVLDRLVGWELSSLLWKKVKGKLSAGRVQSVSVKLVVERERDIRNFKVTPYFKVTADFLAPSKSGKTTLFKAKGPERFENQGDAESFLKKCVGADYTIDDIKVRPTKRKPAPPFITSTLQQEASRKLGFSVSRTMSVAQKLYESGLITYMRTDSTNLSETALNSMRAEIVGRFGANYHKQRVFKAKKPGAQEAHEAIRPTYFDKENVSTRREEQRLYELIWKRALASQMADAELEKTTIKVAISSVPGEKMTALGEVIKFDGFLKLYLESTDEEEGEETQGILPPLAVGQAVGLSEMVAMERFTRAPARFTEASLVKKLEELAIGRPSTYAPTISKIMQPERGYVVKESRDGTERNYQVLTLKDDKIVTVTATERTGASKNHLFPQDIGMLVTDFLDQYFKKVMDYSFTADIESQFDEIASGNREWPKMIDGFYKPFHETVEKTLEEADRVSGERILGRDPESGRTLLVRMSRLGRPVLQIGTGDELGEEEKPRYANLKPGTSLDTITMEEAMASFELPKTLGEYEELEVSVNTGRYGPYVKWGTAFISLPRGEDPYETDFDRAVELILEKKEADKPLAMFKDKPITKGKGRFGPFVKWEKLYANVSAKKYDFENLTPDQAIELIQAKVEKEANRYIKQWPEEKLALERGRWGPFIRFKKKSIKLPKIDDKRMTDEQAAELSLEDVKKIMEEAV